MTLDITLIAPPSGTTYSAGTTSVPLWASGSISLELPGVAVYLYTKGSGKLSTEGTGKLFIFEV